MPRLLAPHTLRYRPLASRAELIEQLGWAATLELSTVPPYLTALYSIQDATTDSAQLIKAVVIEEMLHLALVANLMISIGGQPRFDEHTVPEYPTYIPHHATGGPFISLQPLSQAVAAEVFCAIERPSDLRNPPPEGDNFETIGQFYAAIREGFDRLYDEIGDALFVDHGEKQLHPRYYFGDGGGRLFVVRDIESVHRAIDEIVAQGEGARPHTTGASTDEPFGSPHHYGQRPDGTYGPILGVPREPSHFTRFTELASGAVPIPAVYPMQPNIKSADIPDSSLRGLGQIFDQCYTLVLRYMEAATKAPHCQHFYFGGAVPLMHTVLPTLARLLLQTPLDPRTGSLGPNAGPSFSLVPGAVDPGQVAAELTALANHPPEDLDASSAQDWTATLRGVQPFVANLPSF